MQQAHAGLRPLLRKVYLPLIDRSPTVRMLALLAGARVNRSATFVHDDYVDIWSAYRSHLARCATLDQWLFIPGADDVPHSYHIHGEVQYTVFDHNKFVIDTIATAIRTHFPDARSITEYGCGIGRNLLALKRRFPQLSCYGYELAPAGVEVARAASQKFGVEAKYAALDYVNDAEEKYVHPKTDLALTVYSLEQVPYANLVGVKNMLDHTTIGSIHLEPVSENYPLTYRGILGRLYSYKVDYLKNFDAGVRSLRLRSVRSQVLDTAANNYFYPSLYALVK